MAEVHVVNLSLMKCGAGTGTEDTAPITNKTLLVPSYDNELRVLSNPRVPNSSGHPSVEEYLSREAGDDFVLAYFGQTTLITVYDPIDLEASDIQIGAVELKDHDSDVRVDVSAAGAPSGNGVHVFAYSDAAGMVQYGLVDAQRRVTISPIPGQIGVAAAAGAVDALTQRMTLANNDPAVVSLGIIQTDLTPVTTFHHTAVAVPGDGTDAVFFGDHGVAIVCIQSGAITSATIQFFLGGGGANWTSVLARRVDTNEMATEVAIAGVTYQMWEVPVAGAAGLRVRINAIVPAAATVTIYSRAIVGAAAPDSILRAMAEEDAAAPDLTVQSGGKYEVVPAAIDDGDIGPIAISAYKRPIGVSDNLAVGAKQVLEVAPIEYDVAQSTLRASAALAAAGAYDTPIEIPTSNRKYLKMAISYTRAVANGAYQMRIEEYLTIAGTDYWSRQCIINLGAFASGSDVTHEIQRGSDYTYTSTAAVAEIVNIVREIERFDKIRVSFRESGVIASPGTLACYYKLTN